MNRAAVCARLPLLLLLVLCLSPVVNSQEDGIEAARQLYEQSRQMNRQGQYEAGVPLARRALEIREQVLGSEHSDTAAAVSSLANLLFNKGDMEQAEVLYVRALAIREKVLGAEHPDTAASLGNLGRLAHSRGEFRKAALLYQRSLAIREKAGLEDAALAALLASTGALHGNLGDHSQAERFVQRAIDVAQKALGANHPDVAMLLSILAGQYEVTGLYASAEALHRRSLTILESEFGRDSPRVAFVLNDLGVVYAKAGSHQRAESAYLRALAIYQKALGSEHPTTALATFNLGTLYRDSGAYEKAEQKLIEAAEVHEHLLGSRHPLTVNSLSGLGALYTELGAYGKAEPLYVRALAAQAEPVATDQVSVLRDSALLYWAIGRTARALQLLEQAQVTQARTTARFVLAGSEARNAAYLRTLADATFKESAFAASMPSRDSAELGLTGVLEYKSRVLDAATGAVDRLRASLRAEDRAIFEQLTDIARDISGLTFQWSGQLSAALYRQRLNDLVRQQTELEAVLAKRSSEFRDEVGTAGLPAIRRALPTDAALIEWFRYEALDPRATGVSRSARPARYIAYVLKKSADPVAIDLGPAHEIEALAREFVRAAAAPERRDVRQHALALWRRLFQPLQGHLRGARHLLLSPDGALNLVPMAALVDEQARFLIQRFQITHLTGGRDLLRIAADVPALSSNPVVIGAPDFGSRDPSAVQVERISQQRSQEMDRGGGLSFRSLPGAAEEVVAIRSLLQADNVRALTGLEASEANLKRLHGPRILHVATHGFFLNDRQVRKIAAASADHGPRDALVENPLLRSGLALAGANVRSSGTSEDGILTALEAARLDLRGTELVVLSACETGVGEVMKGEGVAGLRRSLLLAGARTQVSSLWKVADRPTRALMVSFYQHLARGVGRSEALRRAQRELLADPRQSHPYFWAGFVAIGDWKPLSMAN